MSVKEKRSVERIKLYKAAKSLESVSREYGFGEQDIIKLAGNENRYGCSPKVIEALSKQEGQFSYYPDMNVTQLREKLSEKHQISGDNFIFGNGSFELISLIGAAYIDKGDEAISSDPSFGWYLNTTFLNEGVAVKVPVNADKAVDTESILAHITDRTKVIWVCNPNNPTGTVLPVDTLTEFINKVPDRILIALDEAYIEFIDGDYVDTVNFVREKDNVILLRTFSKAQGLASFRIGYGIADTKIIDALNKVKLPISVSLAAQTAALAALQDEDFTRCVIENNKTEREYYYHEFDELGFRYIRSNGNFILVETGIDGAYLEQEFLKRGIIIRNGGEFGLDKWLRISVGRAEENRKVIAVLHEIIAQG